MGSFNPRLTSAARRTSESMLRWPNMDMFQSTPHLSGKANVVIDTERGSASSFNPRLTSAARRTHVWIKVRLGPAGFNPRLTSAARRTGTGYAPLALLNVSIHASPQRQGERRPSDRRALITEFQSTPHLSGKANRGRAHGSPRMAVSIHASPQRQGERAPSATQVAWKFVSIHASPQRQGEPLAIIKTLL